MSGLDLDDWKMSGVPVDEAKSLKDSESKRRPRY